MPQELSRQLAALRPFLVRERPATQRYAIGLLCAALSVGLRVTVWPELAPQTPYLVYLPGVLAASHLGGLGPGAACLAVCAAAALWLQPPDSARHATGVFVFVLFGLLLSAINEYLHRAARAVAGAHDRMSDILESISDGFYALDREGRFTYVNAAAERLWGKRRGELLGRVIWEVFPEAVGSESQRAHERVLAERKPMRFETVSPVLKTWLDVSIHPSSGGLSVYFHDISERRRRRAELESLIERRTARLRELNEELESFTYSASHDLRAPARKIRGYSELLRRKLGGALPGEGKDYLERIEQSTGAMVRVIDEMRGLAEATQRALKPARFDLSGFVSAWCAQRKSREPGRRVRCIVQPGLTASADPGLLGMALEQLLDNAWKFTARRRHAAIEFGASDAASEPVYFVRDDGVGFDMGYQRKLFKPFERLHDTGEFEGPGVGLAIAQRVIRRHGGELWAESKPGEGATFYFTLGEGS